MAEWEANQNGPEANYSTDLGGRAELFIDNATPAIECKNTASSTAKRVKVRGATACLRLWRWNGDDGQDADVDLEWSRAGYALSFVLHAPIVASKAKAISELQAAAAAEDAWFEGCLKAGATSSPEFASNRQQVEPLFKAREVTAQGDTPDREKFFGKYVRSLPDPVSPQGR